MNEEKRERLLKRILPGLVMLVVYFTFVSGRISGQAEEAEKEVESMISRGIAPEALPGIRTQQAQLDEDIKRLKGKQEEFNRMVQERTGLAGHPGYASHVGDRLSLLLEQHALREGNNTVEEPGQNLPKTYRDISQRLQNGKDSHWLLLRVDFTGDYRAAHRVFEAIAKDDTVALLPVNWAMYPPSNETPDLKWSLWMWLGPGA
ncbi:hypothetical protein [Methylocaldum sp.]|uniref:hypothetical protein n=1 Tax=Methylocaldum sp. TaxID=1969727 RepID=UPI002D7507A2|nr:hypothetical protein [Methylocaldum sp.]HYE36084.1 hypothetical protein [Methylocaldum sp.]